MRQLNVKPIKKMCAVKGCGNRATYFISRTGDFAGSANLCKNCISEAMKAIEAKEIIFEKASEQHKNEANDADTPKDNNISEITEVKDSEASESEPIKKAPAKRAKTKQEANKE